MEILKTKTKTIEGSTDGMMYGEIAISLVALMSTVFSQVTVMSNVFKVRKIDMN